MLKVSNVVAFVSPMECALGTIMHGVIVWESCRVFTHICGECPCSEFCFRFVCHQKSAMGFTLKSPIAEQDLH